VAFLLARPIPQLHHYLRPQQAQPRREMGPYWSGDRAGYDKTEAVAAQSHLRGARTGRASGHPRSPLGYWECGHTDDFKCSSRVATGAI